MKNWPVTLHQTFILGFVLATIGGPHGPERRAENNVMEEIKVDTVALCLSLT